MNADFPVKIVNWFFSVVVLEITLNKPVEGVDEVTVPGKYALKFVDPITCRVTSRHESLESAIDDVLQIK